MSREEIDIKCKDVVKGAFEAALEQVPVVNFFISAVGKVKDGVLQRKYDSWQEMVGERLATLEEAVFDTLGENETFATTLLKTTELAAKSNAKKMELLANAVKYASNNEISDDYIIIFLNCIDGYTIHHLTLLKYFGNPARYYTAGKEYFSVSPMVLYNETYSTPHQKYRLLDIIVKQLYNDGFLNTGDLNTGTTMSGALAQRTTDMGRKFIEFFGLNDVEL